MTVGADETGSESPGEVMIVVDGARCIGAGVCLVAAPAHFEFGPDGRSRVRAPDASSVAAFEAAHAALREAAQRCPLGAIRLVAAEGDDGLDSASASSAVASAVD